MHTLCSDYVWLSRLNAYWEGEGGVKLAGVYFLFFPEFIRKWMPNMDISLKQGEAKAVLQND